ncbi:MAG: 30S ribosomal protein S2 [Patescibacteria group bacterium]|jgi:small subunit ribosomal protein S2
MKKPTVEQMLEAGLHFGHQTFRWHPNMKPYIFDSRDGIHIIDLMKTEAKLTDALNFVEQLGREGGTLMLVGTKRQAASLIEALAKANSLPYVANRWPGGLLTNWPTMKGRIRYLKQVREQVAKKDFGDMTKQEIGLLEKKLALLENAFGGLDLLDDLPNAVFIVDTIREKIALREAKKLGIPVIAMLDTNADPAEIEFPIPANDDAKQGIQLITQAIVNAFIAERRTKAQVAAAKKAEEETEAVSEAELEEVLAQKEVVEVAEKQEEAEKESPSKTKKTSIKQ